MRAEGMDIAIAQGAPVFEGNAQLEAGLGRAHEFPLVKFEQAMKP
jgi:hypothetical protein